MWETMKVNGVLSLPGVQEDLNTKWHLKRDFREICMGDTSSFADMCTLQEKEPVQCPWGRHLCLMEIQNEKWSQCGQETSKRESDERWCLGILRNKVASLLQLKLQDTGSPSFTWCSLHFIDLYPRDPVNKNGSILYFQVLVSIMVYAF